MSNNVAHLWAAKNLDGAEVKLLKKNTGESSNFYWQNDTIYSYGRHFPIACVHELKTIQKGKMPKMIKYVLFTTRTYSITTSKHISDVRSALYGRAVPVFYVEDPWSLVSSETEKANFEARIKEALNSMARAKSKAGAYLASAQSYVKDGNRMAEFFGFKWRLKMPKNLEALKAQVKADDKKRAVAARERAERSRAWHLNALELWVNGQARPEKPSNVDGLKWNDNLPTRLRLVGNTVETSRGANVPASDAFKLIQAIRAGLPIEDMKVGTYIVNGFNAEGALRIGCHTIEAAEVDRIESVLIAAKA